MAKNGFSNELYFKEVAAHEKLDKELPRDEAWLRD